MRKAGEQAIALRHLIREPLGTEELRRLAALVGDPRELVAPKRRAEAEGLAGDKLIAWLAADGARVRRPIVVVGKKVTLGFKDPVREELEKLL